MMASSVQELLKEIQILKLNILRCIIKVRTFIGNPVCKYMQAEWSVAVQHDKGLQKSNFVVVFCF